MKKFLIVALLALGLTACSKVNVPDIKQHANKVWEDNGFKVVGYEGYEYGSMGQWGGCVWYIVSRENVTYHGCISKWEDEYHIYSLRAMDAISANK
jgi:hypothetical protein